MALDLHRSQAGRSRADNHESNAREMRRILQNLRYKSDFDVEEVDGAGGVAGARTYTRLLLATIIWRIILKARHAC